MARVGASAVPPVEAPGPLRRYLRFQKLPPAALEAARRVIDADEAFRLRVREAVVAAAEAAPGEGGVEGLVGEAGWLLIDRPDGWEDRLVGLLAEVEQGAAVAADEREERRASRQLVRTRLELDRARRDEAAARADADEARAEASDDRERRARAEREVEGLAERLATTDAARAEAVRQLKVVEQRLAERGAEVRSLRDDLAAAQSALDEASAGRVEATTDQPGSRSDERGSDPHAAVATVPSPGVPDSGAPALDREGLAAAVGAAARAAAELSQALARATAVLGTMGEGSAPASVPSADRGPEGEARLGSGSGRVAARLPTGMFDDGADAALFLLRLPAAVLVVDGYNVSLTGWPDQALPVQRRRLVDALRNLQARTGAEPIVVFDGAEAQSGPSASLPRSVQVRFSPPGISADDVVVAMVDQLPEDRPVVVASSDREVRDGARARGANTISAGQLVALLRDA